MQLLSIIPKARVDPGGKDIFTLKVSPGLGRCMGLIIPKVSSDPRAAGSRISLPLRAPQTLVGLKIPLPLKSSQTLAGNSQEFNLPKGL